MASHNLKHRTREDPDITTRTYNDRENKAKPLRNAAIAKRGLRSLAIGVSVPLSLTLLSLHLGAGRSCYGTLSKRFWLPPPWALHMTCLASSFLMNLSAWLVWAVGGFHRKPTALYLYLAQLGLSLAWNQIVLGAGASRIGLLVCLAMFGAVVGCYRMFKEVNPIAGDLTKPCLAWTAFLAIVNLKLLFL